jgi:hypothetical protein
MGPGTHGHELLHLVAGVVLVVGGATFVLASIRRRGTAPRGVVSSLPAATVGRSLTVMVAGLSAGAAVIHLVAAPHHYAELGELGAGFLAAAVFQGTWAMACLSGPSTRTRSLGIVINAAIVLAWVYTRAVGLPVGELAGSPEPIGFPDAASVVFELLLISGLVVMRSRSADAEPPRATARVIASIAVVPVLGLTILTTSLATVAIANGLDHGLGDPSGHGNAPFVSRTHE